MKIKIVNYIIFIILDLDKTNNIVNLIIYDDISKDISNKFSITKDTFCKYLLSVFKNDLFYHKKKIPVKNIDTEVKINSSDFIYSNQLYIYINWITNYLRIL